MAREKIRYKVRCCTYGGSTWNFLGETMAVSPEEAIAHVIFRVYGPVNHESLEMDFRAKEVILNLKPEKSTPKNNNQIWSAHRQMLLPGCEPKAMFL